MDYIQIIFRTRIDINDSYMNYVWVENGTKMAKICSKRAHFSVRILVDYFWYEKDTKTFYWDVSRPIGQRYRLNHHMIVG